MSDTLSPEQLYQQAATLLNISQATMNEGTVQEAYDLLKKSADLGNSRAAYDYAHYQYHKLGDHTIAFNYVQKALGDDPQGKAHYLLGLLYYHGKGCEKNDARSYELHKEAAARGNADAMFELYVYYSQGIGCEKDPAKAFDWNAKAAETGQYRACFNMGWFYETGTNVDQDMDKAFQYYQTASNNGNGKATAYVGVMYEKGMVEPPETLDENGEWDEEKARKIAYTWYRKAENEQDFHMVYDYLDSLGLYYDEDEYAEED
jgi:TPR repeat protein